MMTTSICRPDDVMPQPVEMITEWLGLIHEPGTLVEMRVPSHGKPPRTLSGVFDRLDHLAAAARAATPDAPNVYMTLNPVVHNFDTGRVVNTAGYGLASVGAAHVARRRWLLIDVDPERLAGTSATDAEKGCAADVSDAVGTHLRDSGWPDPVIADSGNGYHLLYRIDHPADPADYLVRRCLIALAERFDTPEAKVDRAVHDLARLVKLYGTLSKKGEHTAERPWRVSGILSVPPGGAQVVSGELLEALAESVPSRAARRPSGAMHAPAGPVNGDDIKPGDAFDRHGPDWDEILEPHGWQLLTLRGDEGHWRRPGKEAGNLSATTGHCRGGRGESLFKVFSSNAPPFKEGEAYGKFRAYSLLNHGGDFSAAASALSKMGYGSSPRRTKQAPPSPADEPPAPAPRPSGMRSNEPGTNGAHPSTPPPRVPTKMESVPRLAVTTFDKYDVEPIRWLVPDRIPLGMITVMAGEGGGGKSTITLSLAASLSRGEPAFGMIYDAPARADTLVIGCEDDVRRTTKPRLLAMGAEVSRIGNLDGTADESGKVRPWSLSSVNLEALGLYLVEHPETRLVIIDPVTAFVGATGADDHRDSEIRALLGPLSEMAGKRDVAVILVMHLNKATGLSAVGRILGSVGYVNTARMAYVVARDPDDDSRQLVVPCKQNISSLKTGITFTLDALPTDEAMEIATRHGAALTEDDQFQLAKQLYRPTWRGESEASADDAVAPRKPKAGGGELGKCIMWLTAFLTPNARKAEDVLTAAKNAGFSEATLERTKQEMKASHGLVNKPLFSRGPWWLGLGPSDTWTFTTGQAQHIES